MVGECGTNMAHDRQTAPQAAPARSTRSKLDELALAYVGRFATSRAKLHYLTRKLSERGWDGDGEPPIDALAERLAELGFVDDAAFALSKARSLTARGYGERRVAAGAACGRNRRGGQRAARSELADGGGGRGRAPLCPPAPIRALCREAARSRSARSALAAMIRAGHGFGLARQIIELDPGR